MVQLTLLLLWIRGQEIKIWEAPCTFSPKYDPFVSENCEKINYSNAFPLNLNHRNQHFKRSF